jgi:hypothetical protein
MLDRAISLGHFAWLLCSADNLDSLPELRQVRKVRVRVRVQVLRSRVQVRVRVRVLRSQVQVRVRVLRIKNEYISSRPTV